MLMVAFPAVAKLNTAVERHAMGIPKRAKVGSIFSGGWNPPIYF